MKKQTTAYELQERWERAVERAAEENMREQELNETLTESAGLHIKSGVDAAGVWGTTSCTCQNTCL